MSPLEALQATLATEHAAVRLYSVWAARTSRTEQPQVALALSRGYLTHRARRDACEEMVRAQGETPEPGAVEYQDPAGPDSASAVSAAVLELEEACAQRYSALVAAATDAVRDWAVDALRETAVSTLEWGAPPAPFPGAPEL